MSFEDMLNGLAPISKPKAGGKYTLPLGFLSPTQIEMYLKCPRQYKFRYAERLKMPPGVALAEGGSHHIVLHHNNLNKVKTGKDFKPRKAFETFADAFDTECKNVEDWEGETKDSILKRGKHMIHRYLALFAPNVQPISKDSIEHSFVSDIAGLEIRGIIDVCVRPAEQAERVVVAEAAMLTIIDYKTGKKARSSGEVLASIQLGCYGIHLAQKLPRGNRIDAGFCILKKTMSANPISYTGARITQKRMKHTKKVIVDVAKSISLGSFPRCDPSHWICNPKYCGYHRKCYG